MSAKRHQIEIALLAIVGSVLVSFLLVPLASLFLTTSVADLIAGMTSAAVWPALRLSLLTTSASLVVVVALGTPLAWILANGKSRLTRAIETLLQLPIVIPPAVAGVALLLTFGHRGLLTGKLYPHTVHFAFTTVAVVMAEVFVSAPFFIQSAVSAFRRIDTRLLVVAASLGALPFRVFWRIGVPLALPGLVGGAALSWARALGEFGATLMFAGNLEGKTQTLPLAIYSALEIDLRTAQAMSVMLVVVAFGLLFVVRSRVNGTNRSEQR